MTLCLKVVQLKRAKLRYATLHAKFPTYLLSERTFAAAITCKAFVKSFYDFGYNVSYSCRKGYQDKAEASDCSAPHFLDRCLS